MVELRETPPSIREHKYGAIFGAEWQKIHNRMDGNSFNFFIGSNGTGKTYAALKRAEIVGVDENDSYGRLFDPDHLENHVFFDKTDMLSKIAKLEKKGLEKTRGYQIILDEAQVTANAKEWNNREVLNFSKDMTTIRSSRLSIVLTMPSHRMITTDLRQLGIYQVEMFPAETLDLKNGISYSKIHFLKLNPHTSEIWRYRPLTNCNFISPITGFGLVRRARLSQITWNLPSRKVRRNYENMKAAFREQRSEEHEQTKEIQEKKNLLKQTVESIRKNIDYYRDPKKGFSWEKIVKDYDVSVATAYRVVAFLKKDEAIN